MVRVVGNVRWSLLCSLLLVVGCPDGGGGGDDWELDASIPDSDVGQQADTTDGTDTDSFEPCPSAPTARLSATAPSADQPVDGTHAGRLQVTPLPTISLDSSASTATDGHSVDRVEWSILDRPKPSLVTFGEMGLGDRQDTPIYMTSEEAAPKLEVTLAGTYKIGLKVWNDLGKESCNTATLTIDVRPDSELYVDFRNPYEELNVRRFEQQAFGQNEPSMKFRLKRTRSADWDNLDNVIPNTRLTGGQDWGEVGNSEDDPVLGRVRSYYASNGFIALNDIEESITYQGGVNITGNGGPFPATVRVYIDGNLQKVMKQTLLDEYEETPVFFEVFSLTKRGQEIKIKETWARTSFE